MEPTGVILCVTYNTNLGRGGGVVEKVGGIKRVPRLGKNDGT